MSTNQQIKYRQVRVSEKDHGKLKLLSVASGKTMSKLIGRMIHDLFEARGGQKGLKDAIHAADTAMETIRQARALLNAPIGPLFDYDEAKKSDSENPPKAPKAPRA